MSLNRTEQRFLAAGDAIALHERMKNKTAARIARAEWQYLYNLLGVERARELIDTKYEERG